MTPSAMKQLGRWFVVLALLMSARAAEVKEEAISHAGVKFRVVRVMPQQVKLVWQDGKDGEDGKGQPFRTFDRVQAHFTKEGKTVRFIMNAGLFEEGGIPCGLHVEGGKQFLPLNTRAGEGNFYLKPNGVFAMGAAPAIMVPEAFKLAGTKLALQSGPVLLIDGKRHPAFKEGSANKLHRNGVGVDAKGNVVFAITARGEMVNFWDFAGLFESLGCRNALFLDGTISQMVVNPEKPVESNPFGAMFVVAD